MKAQTRKGSNKTEGSKKTVFIDSRDKDIVFEAVDEALIPQATLNDTRKTHRK